MRTSDAARVDYEYRHWRKAKALLEAIASRSAWYHKHCADRLSPLHGMRIAEVQALLNRELEGQSLRWEIGPAVLIDTYLKNTPRKRDGGRKGGTGSRGAPPSAQLTEGDGGRSPQEGPAKREAPPRYSRRSTGNNYHEIPRSRDLALLRMPSQRIMDYVFDNLPPPRKAQLSDLENHMATLMTKRYHQAMAKQHYFALMCEIAYRAKQGWYFVFNTLTVKPEYYSHAFSHDSPFFRAYIQKVNRAAGKSACGSIRKSKEIDFHSYLGCTEQGSQNGRLHLHVLHCFKTLPDGCTDPNYGKAEPKERCLYYFHGLWSAGRSEARMVRYSPNDAYGLSGFRWPVEKGEPLKVKSPLAVANYISKYIEQGYDTCLRRKLQWRVKKSHKLGHGLLNEMLEPLSTSTLWVIVSLDALNLKLNNTPIPLPLMRHLSLKILQGRLSSQSTSVSTTLTTLAKRTMPRLSPLHCLRASTKTILESSRASSQFLSTLGLNETVTYEAALDELRTQLRIINRKYFLSNIGIVGSASASHTVYKRPQHIANEAGLAAR